MAGQSGMTSEGMDSRRDAANDSIETMIVKAVLVGANANFASRGNDLMSYKCNYFVGNDQSQWRTDVPSYKAVVLEEVYPGIDLTYYGNGQRMEYDFVVSPGADYSKIQVKYDGAESVAVATDGSLTVTTAWGEIKELAPVVYQNVNGERRAVTSEFTVQDDNTFGFQLGKEYDRTQPVTIDPELVYSTYLGGNGSQKGYDIALDSSGCVYVMGDKAPGSFPIIDPGQKNGQGITPEYTDIFVTKLSSSGDSLVYSTTLAGSSWDFGYGIALDASGAVYVTGSTYSSDFPTLNAYQSTFQGVIDVFVTKLSSSGSLSYSTFLGGSDSEIGADIAVVSGAAYVTGWTWSSNFPTLNAYQSTNQGACDVFVTKLSTGGNSLAYSTHIGGSLSEGAEGIFVNPSGVAYVAGSTVSSNFPTVSPYQGNQAGEDGFVAQLSSTGNNLLYSTYLGGDSAEVCRDITVDASGNMYVTGWTTSTNFPTVNPYQTFQGSDDAFVTKLSVNGSSLVFSTYLGGSDWRDNANGIAVDGSGAVYVTGSTQSNNFPTVNEFQTDQGDVDAFVARLSSEGGSLAYSSYLGGSGSDGGNAIAVDASGGVYITGTTWSSDFPIVNAYQGTYQNIDAFITKIEAASCCVGRTGDADQSGGDEPTISDVNILIDVLFISLDWSVIHCMSEADVNQSGGGNPAQSDITMGDVSYLIDYLFITGPELGLPNCL